jgi:O-antigen ligase
MKAPRIDLRRLQLGLFGAFAASAFASIFASGTLLYVALAVLLVRLLLGRTPVVRTPLDAPILAFAVWTLLSASFSLDSGASLQYSKKLLLLGVFFLAVDTLAEPRSRERVTTVALLGGIALAGLVVVQYHALGFLGVNNRPRGFLGHYMSAAGLVMSATVVAAARLAFGRQRPRLSPGDGLLLALVAGALTLLAIAHAAGLGLRGTQLAVAGLVVGGGTMATIRGSWPSPATGGVLAAVMLPLGTWALLVSRTRNAWIGALVGVGVVVLLRARKALLVLAAAALLVIVVRPASVMDRLTLTDASSVDRYYMWQAGIDMIHDKPVFGQGPGMILRQYPVYRWPEAPNAQAPHLHDNLLQLAAERGIPCALFWLWWMASALQDAWGESRRLLATPERRGDGWVAVAALAAGCAVMASGLFEYNFGDSEVLMFFLLVSALPYALRRQRTLLAVSGP